MKERSVVEWVVCDSVTEYSGVYDRQLMSTDTCLCPGLIFISALMGVAANRLGPRAQVFVDFFAGATEIVLMVMRWFFW